MSKKNKILGENVQKRVQKAIPFISK